MNLLGRVDDQGADLLVGHDEGLRGELRAGERRCRPRPRGGGSALKQPQVEELADGLRRRRDLGYRHLVHLEDVVPRPHGVDALHRVRDLLLHLPGRHDEQRLEILVGDYDPLLGEQIAGRLLAAGPEGRLHGAEGNAEDLGDDVGRLDQIGPFDGVVLQLILVGADGLQAGDHLGDAFLEFRRRDHDHGAEGLVGNDEGLARFAGGGGARRARPRHGARQLEVEDAGECRGDLPDVGARHAVMGDLALAGAEGIDLLDDGLDLGLDLQGRHDEQAAEVVVHQNHALVGVGAALRLLPAPRGRRTARDESGSALALRQAEEGAHRIGDVLKLAVLDLVVPEDAVLDAGRIEALDDLGDLLVELLGSAHDHGGELLGRDDDDFARARRSTRRAAGLPGGRRAGGRPAARLAEHGREGRRHLGDRGVGDAIETRHPLPGAADIEREEGRRDKLVRLFVGQDYEGVEIRVGNDQRIFGQPAPGRPRRSVPARRELPARRGLGGHGQIEEPPDRLGDVPQRGAGDGVVLEFEQNAFDVEVGQHLLDLGVRLGVGQHHERRDLRVGGDDDLFPGIAGLPRAAVPSAPRPPAAPLLGARRPAAGVEKREELLRHGLGPRVLEPVVLDGALAGPGDIEILERRRHEFLRFSLGQHDQRVEVPVGDHGGFVGDFAVLPARAHPHLLVRLEPPPGGGLRAHRELEKPSDRLGELGRLGMGDGVILQFQLGALHIEIQEHFLDLGVRLPVGEHHERREFRIRHDGDVAAAPERLPDALLGPAPPPRPARRRPARAEEGLELPRHGVGGGVLEVVVLDRALARPFDIELLERRRHQLMGLAVREHDERVEVLVGDDHRLVGDAAPARTPGRPVGSVEAPEARRIGTDGQLVEPPDRLGELGRVRVGDGVVLELERRALDIEIRQDALDFAVRFLVRGHHQRPEFLIGHNDELASAIGALPAPALPGGPLPLRPGRPPAPAEERLKLLRHRLGPRVGEAVVLDHPLARPLLVQPPQGVGHELLRLLLGQHDKGVEVLIGDDDGLLGDAALARLRAGALASVEAPEPRPIASHRQVEEPADGRRDFPGIRVNDRVVLELEHDALDIEVREHLPDLGVRVLLGQHDQRRRLPFGHDDDRAASLPRGLGFPRTAARPAARAEERRQGFRSIVGADVPQGVVLDGLRAPAGDIELLHHGADLVERLLPGDDDERAEVVVGDEQIRSIPARRAGSDRPAGPPLAAALGTALHPTRDPPLVRRRESEDPADRARERLQVRVLHREVPELALLLVRRRVQTLDDGFHLVVDAPRRDDDDPAGILFGHDGESFRRAPGAGAPEGAFGRPLAAGPPPSPRALAGGAVRENRAQGARQARGALALERVVFHELLIGILDVERLDEPLEILDLLLGGRDDHGAQPGHGRHRHGRLQVDRREAARRPLLLALAPSEDLLHAEFGLPLQFRDEHPILDVQDGPELLDEFGGIGVPELDRLADEARPRLVEFVQQGADALHVRGVVRDPQEVGAGNGLHALRHARHILARLGHLIGKHVLELVKQRNHTVAAGGLGEGRRREGRRRLAGRGLDLHDLVELGLRLAAPDQREPVDLENALEDIVEVFGGDRLAGEQEHLPLADDGIVEQETLARVLLEDPNSLPQVSAREVERDLILAGGGRRRAVLAARRGGSRFRRFRGDRFPGRGFFRRRGRSRRRGERGESLRGRGRLLRRANLRGRRHRGCRGRRGILRRGFRAPAGDDHNEERNQKQDRRHKHSHGVVPRLGASRVFIIIRSSSIPVRSATYALISATVRACTAARSAGVSSTTARFARMYAWALCTPGRDAAKAAVSRSSVSIRSRIASCFRWRTSAEASAAQPDKKIIAAAAHSPFTTRLRFPLS